MANKTRRGPRRWVRIGTWCLLAWWACPGIGLAAEADASVYLGEVKPLLKARCYACHGALKQKGNLRLDTASALLRGGDGGPAIVAGRSGESGLIERVAAPEASERMPPDGPPLTSSQVDTLRRWIDSGAAAPGDVRPETDPRRHWAFVPPARPVVPLPRDATAGCPLDPIDAFLEAERRARGLEPLPAASREVWLRRVSLDLIGLPPTRAELAAFLADSSIVAYERVVDRLLASPRYGERWARHWMDVWRYSDWYGRRAVPDVLNSYAQIWRWRDWIVSSLNGDQGYDRMVRAMLAADELAPSDPSELVATGFLVRNWYRWNYNTWMKDNVEHVGKAFLGLTMNCAHCHDHKYDPLTQDDYFALRAVFEPLELRHDRVPGEPDPGPYPKYEYAKSYGPITSGLVRVFDEKLDAQTFVYTKGESRNVVPGRPPVAPGVPRFLDGGRFHVTPVALPAESAYPGLLGFVRDDERSKRTTACRAAAEKLAQSRREADAMRRAVRDAWNGWLPRVPLAFEDPLLGIPAFATPPMPPALADLLDRARRAARSLRVDEAAERSARADRAALEARIAADDARHHRTSADPVPLARRASRAERAAAASRAALDLARAEFSREQAGKQPARAQAQAQAQAKAEAGLTAARRAHEAALVELRKESESYTPLSPVYPSHSTGRRTALARWITDESNPLTARVAVNHLWRWHFGQPLVATTFDFGRNGASPTHPALLDWLAVELMRPSAPGIQPWSFKHLHRRIVLSASYRMASHPSDPRHPGFDRDRENRWYWRFPSARMEAEVVRDSLLHLAGRLDTRIGGPDIDLDKGLAVRRRSLYFTHHGEARMPFLELFDAPDACDAYRRTTSVVPQQALALVNNDLIVQLSGDLADRLAQEEGRDSVGQHFVRGAFQQVLGRLPTTAEQALAERFLKEQAAALARRQQPPGDAVRRARRDLVQALFSHNDFITIH